MLLEASRGATRSASAPVVLADAGVENVNVSTTGLAHSCTLSLSWTPGNPDRPLSTSRGGRTVSGIRVQFIDRILPP